MLKIIEKIKELQKRVNFKGLFKNPLFYFGFFSFLLLGTICFGYDSFAGFYSLKNSEIVFFNNFFNNKSELKKDDLFFSQKEVLALETPDLKIIQDNAVGGIFPPRILTPQVLGDIFGESVQNGKDIIEYVIQPGDTLKSIAASFNISLNTLLWANDLEAGSKIKSGQILVILPVSGLIYVVRSGDTISELSKTYKSKIDDIVAFNDLSNEGDIFIGDILVLPDGVIPPKKKIPSPVQTPLADSFFIFPTQGIITQRLHFYNAVDIANKCGTPFYAAAAGTVQRVRYGWNMGGGNYITILHSGGITTYYGHLMTSFVKPGDTVNVGDQIGLIGGGRGMAGAGRSTGCHLHFEARGARNPLAGYALGASIKYSLK